jgi:hypothetical protein
MHKHDVIDTVWELPERRREQRWEPRGGVEVACRVGTSGLGPDVALALIDLSAFGGRLLVREDLPAGEVVEVCLYTTAGPGWFRQFARVTWSSAARGGHYFVGIVFETPLTDEACSELHQLCRPGPS